MGMSSRVVDADQVSSALDVISRVGEVLGHVYDDLSQVRLPSSIVDGSVVLQGCLPLLLEGTPAQALKEQVGQKKYEMLHDLHQQSSLQNLWYGLELKNILEAFESAQVPVMVLKGADLAMTLYPRPELRHFGDVDLMVQPKDLAEAKAILEHSGYHYHREYRFEAVSKQRVAFVYVKKVPTGYLLFEIHTSPHSNEMGISFASFLLWERARRITIAGSCVYGMGLEDLLLYLCWHYRSHEFSRLIWLYDIALILLSYADQLDWAIVRRLAHQLGLSATLYFCAHLCQEVFHITVPEAAKLEMCKPPAYVQWLKVHFIGDNLTSVLHRTARRKRKLLQYLLVDNFCALCRMGLRAFFPSPTHLGRLYMEHSPLPLSLFWLYYFVHPLNVLKEVCKMFFQ
jgi:hypothetical protein